MKKEKQKTRSLHFTLVVFLALLTLSPSLRFVLVVVVVIVDVVVVVVDAVVVDLSRSPPSLASLFLFSTLLLSFPSFLLLAFECSSAFVSPPE